MGNVLAHLVDLLSGVFSGDSGFAASANGLPGRGVVWSIRQVEVAPVERNPNLKHNLYLASCTDFKMLLAPVCRAGETMKLCTLWRSCEPRS